MQWFATESQLISNKDSAILNKKVIHAFSITFIKLFLLSIALFFIYLFLLYKFSLNEYSSTVNESLQQKQSNIENIFKDIQLTNEEEVNRFSALTYNGLDHKNRVFTISNSLNEYVQSISYLDLGTNIIDEFIPDPHSKKFRYILSQNNSNKNQLKNYYIDNNRQTIYGFFNEKNINSDHSFYVASPMFLADDTVAVIITAYSEKLLLNQIENNKDIKILFKNQNKDELSVQRNKISLKKLLEKFNEYSSFNYISENFDRIHFKELQFPYDKDMNNPVHFYLYQKVNPTDIIIKSQFKIYAGLFVLITFIFLNLILSYYYALNKAAKWLAQMENAVRAMAFDCSEGLIIRDADGIIVNVNQGIINSSGYKREEFIGTNISLIDNDQIIKITSSGIYEKARSLNGWRGEVMTYSKSGNKTISLLIIGVSFYENSNIAYYVESYSDVTKIKDQESNLRIAAVAFETQNSLAITDANGRIQKINQAFTHMTGYTEAEVLHKKPNILNSGKHNDAFYQSMWEALVNIGHWRGAIWNRRKDGTVYLELKVINAVKDDIGNTTHYVSNGLDFTLQNELEKKLEKISKTDELTQLYNRRYFQEMLKEQMSICRRYNKKFSIMIIDLDHFKAINDNFGHDVGDKTLRHVAEILKKSVRETDTVFRWGGEEFVVLLPETNINGITIMSERIRSSIEHSNCEPPITCSIGATALINQDDEDSILKRADDALYSAKLSRNSIKIADL